jgi:hypothetical protein
MIIKIVHLNCNFVFYYLHEPTCYVSTDVHLIDFVNKIFDEDKIYCFSISLYTHTVKSNF